MNYTVVGMLQSESARNFEAEIEFLLTIAPHLEYGKTVTIIDGDPAMIAALEEKLKGDNHRRLACLFHQSANVKEKIQPFLKRYRGKQFEDEDEGKDISSKASEFVEENLYPTASSSSSSSSLSASQSEKESDFLVNFRSSVENAGLEKHSWYTIFQDIRNSPSKNMAFMKLDVLIEEGLPYAKYLKRTSDMWLLCNFTWELTFGCESTQLQEGVFGSLKLFTGYERILSHQVISFTVFFYQ
jgi:hypothetical protein